MSLHKLATIKKIIKNMFYNFQTSSRKKIKKTKSSQQEIGNQKEKSTVNKKHKIG